MVPGLGILQNLCDSCDKISKCVKYGFEALLSERRRLKTNKTYALFVSHDFLASFPMKIALKIVKGIL